MSVAILVPVLHRPHRVAPLLAAIEAATPEAHRVLFLADIDDTDELAALHDAGAETVTGTWARPNYAPKMNTGVRLTTEPFVFLAADDVIPHLGWLSACLALMENPRIGVVGTNDGGCNQRVQRGEHSTHSLVRRSYIVERGTIDQPGRLLHEGYGHSYVDDELIATARHRRAYAHAHDALVEHHHPYADTAVMDSTYRLGMSTIAADRKLWERRQVLLRAHR